MLRLRINWTGVAQGFSILHFTPASDDQTAADAAADAVTVWLNALDTYISVLEDMVVDSEVLVVNEATGDATGVFTVSQPSVPGISSDNPLPNATMALQRWRTGVFLQGREVRGRTFIPALTEIANDADGNLAAGAITAYNTAAATLISTSELAVWSPTRNNAEPVLSGSVWGEFAVLRSRRD